MVDSVEIRLDQLTQAVKGLYAKSSMSQGEIYNALNSLSQRYENLTSVSSEKVASTLVNEFRKTFEIKYNQTNRQIAELENKLKEFATKIAVQNPQLSSEIGRLVNEMSNNYAKLSSQDNAFKKIISELELQKNNNPTEEIVKLSENFMAFSRGFENITITLNKNFADFLAQVKQSGPKEEINNVISEMQVISGNVNSIISAISIIDTKYQDLTGLVGAIQNRENIFNDALKEVHNLTHSIEEMKQSLAGLDSRQDLQSLEAEVKNKVEELKYEIQKVINTTHDLTIRDEIIDLTDNVKNLTDGIGGTRQEVETFQNAIANFSAQLQEVHSSMAQVNPKQLSEALLNLQDQIKIFENSFTKLDPENLTENLSNLQNEVYEVKSLINSEIIYNANKKETEFATFLNSSKEDVKNLSESVKGVIFEINNTIENLRLSIKDSNSELNDQMVSSLKSVIETFQEKLDNFQNQNNLQNSAGLKDIKTIISSIKESLMSAIDRMHSDAKSINQETLDILKVDLQKLSDHLIDGIEDLSKKVENALTENKLFAKENADKQIASFENLSEKINVFELSIENFLKTLNPDKMREIVASNNNILQSSIENCRSDIIDAISNYEKTQKSALSKFEIKIDKVLEDYSNTNLSNITEKKSLRQLVSDIGSKIDKTNLQQIHNAKELLEEIQNTATNISEKISAMKGIKNSSSSLDGLETVVKELKKDIDERLKENIDQISLLFDKPDDTKGIKSELAKITALVKRISSPSETPSYTYTLEDVESDLTKICIAIEKIQSSSDSYRSLQERIAELRNVGLENVKRNRDLEEEIGHLTGWCKDAVSKIDDLSQKFDDVQNNSLSDLKTRLVQSEKSKYDNSTQNAKIENALKVLIKNARTKDEIITQMSKKIELMSKSQSDNFNPSQFIDIFYENMTQTKMLSNRVEIIEDKINAIQGAVEKLLSYVES